MSIADDIKLAIYNDALLMAGSRKIASLTEDREPRRLLDSVYDAGMIRYVLEQGQWIFAKRSMSITYDPDFTVPFGWQFAFDRPTDFVRTMAVSQDSRYKIPLTDVLLTGSKWFCNLDTIYIQYVSDDAQYGSDLSTWPETFKKFVACYMAWRIAPRLKNGADVQQLEKDMKTYLISAQSKDAQQDPTKFMPVGSWVSARAYGSRANRFNGPGSGSGSF